MRDRRSSAASRRASKPTRRRASGSGAGPRKVAPKAGPRAGRPTAARARAGEQVAARLCQAVLAGEGVARAEIGFVYGDDAALRALNARFRQTDRATDVLSFTYEDGLDPRGERVLSGDVAVSVPRVVAQAKRFRVSLGRELARLLTHGALHLCGHDHVKVGERRIMRARERRHLNALTAPEENALTDLVRAWSGEKS